MEPGRLDAKWTALGADKFVKNHFDSTLQENFRQWGIKEHRAGVATWLPPINLLLRWSGEWHPLTLRTGALLSIRAGFHGVDGMNLPCRRAVGAATDIPNARPVRRVVHEVPANANEHLVVR